ncbi:hypothetical protein ACX0HA_05740 [Flavobacterium hauense]
MEAKKDIGKAIREKLDSLERQPGDALWNAISKDLDNEDKKKSKFPFFWFYVVSCTLIGIVVTAFVFSNLTRIDTDSAVRPDAPAINSAPQSAVTEGIPAPEKNDQTDTSVSNKPTESKNVANTSASALKNTDNKNSSGVSVVPVTQKNKASQNRKLPNNHLIEKEGFTTNNTTSNNSGKKSAKHNTATTANITKTKKTSKNKVPQSYAQTDIKSASQSGNSRQHNDSGSTTDNSKNTKSQTADRTTSANNLTSNTKVIAKAGENNDSSSGKDNTSSSIDTKNIGAVNTSPINDSTKNVVDSLKTVIAETKEEEKKDDKKDSIPPVPYKKLSVYAYGGPSYFSFPGRKIVTDSTTSDIKTKSTIRFGVLFGYSLNHKLSIRAGLSIYKLKQSANGIKLNYTMESTGTEIGLVPTPDFTWIDYKQLFGTNNGVIMGQLGDNHQAVINIDRELSYVEIPLEVNYNLFDRRFGFNIFGGGSMLLLNKNEVTAYNEKGKMHLGEWNAAAKTSFTGTLGLGLYYKFTPSLQLNAEPVFNYYFDTYKDSKPYSFTLRLGLQYNFDF